MTPPDRRTGQYVRDPNASDEEFHLDVSRLSILREYFRESPSVASDMMALSLREQLWGSNSIFDDASNVGNSVYTTVGILGSGHAGAALLNPEGRFAGNVRMQAVGRWLTRGSWVAATVVGGIDVMDAIDEGNGYRAVESGAGTAGAIGGCAAGAAATVWLFGVGGIVGCAVGGTVGYFGGRELAQASPLGEIAQEYFDGQRLETIADLESRIYGRDGHRGAGEIAAPMAAILDYEADYERWGQQYNRKNIIDGNRTDNNFAMSRWAYDNMVESEGHMIDNYERIVNGENPLGISNADYNQLVDWHEAIAQERAELQAAMGYAANQDTRGYGRDAERLGALLDEHGIDYLNNPAVERLGLDPVVLEHYRMMTRLAYMEAEVNVTIVQANSWRLFNGIMGGQNPRFNADTRDQIQAENVYLITEVMPALRSRGVDDPSITVCGRNGEESCEEVEAGELFSLSPSALPRALSWLYTDESLQP